MDHQHGRIIKVLESSQEELNISDEQLSRIRDSFFVFEEKMIKKKSENELQRLEMRKLMQNSEKPDYGKIKAALSQNSESRQIMVIEGLKLREEIMNTLTPEQRDALKAKMKDFKKGGRSFQRGNHRRDRGDRGRNRFSRRFGNRDDRRLRRKR